MTDGEGDADAGMIPATPSCPLRICFLATMSVSPDQEGLRLRCGGSYLAAALPRTRQTTFAPPERDRPTSKVPPMRRARWLIVRSPIPHHFRRAVWPPS